MDLQIFMKQQMPDERRPKFAREYFITPTLAGSTSV
jgi:hypothetical protein